MNFVVNVTDWFCIDPTPRVQSTCICASYCVCGGCEIFVLCARSHIHMNFRTAEPILMKLGLNFILMEITARPCPFNSLEYVLAWWSCEILSCERQPASVILEPWSDLSNKYYYDIYNFILFYIFVTDLTFDLTRKINEPPLGSWNLVWVYVLNIPLCCVWNAVGVSVGVIATKCKFGITRNKFNIYGICA